MPALGGNYVCASKRTVTKTAQLKAKETPTVGIGTSPFFPYSVCVCVPRMVFESCTACFFPCWCFNQVSQELYSDNRFNRTQNHSRAIFQKAGDHPQFQEKRSRSERAILGALGEFRGILGAALGIGNSILAKLGGKASFSRSSQDRLEPRDCTQSSS